MKIVSFVAALLLVFSLDAQYSYYFAEPLPSANHEIKHVDETFYGSYTTKDGTLTYQFDENGITIVSTTITSISKETVRESAEYTVRNGYLFGVEENDSVPCVLEDGNYFFGIRNYDIHVGVGSRNVLTKTNTRGTYVLNVFENGKYVPKLLRFNGKKLEIAHFDYQGEDAKEFEFIAEKEELPMEGLTLILLKPTAADFDRIEGTSFSSALELKRNKR